MSLSPLGALYSSSATTFRVWAPNRSRVDVVIDGRETPMRYKDGYHEIQISDVQPGTRYKYRLDGGDAFPDPVSRFQPEGPHGPSVVVDPQFEWSDSGWRGTTLEGMVLYEMHIGTFTKDGTWAAAAKELPELAAAGITCLEVMPIADFAGTFGWGYDGVNLFAPTRLYGEPADVKRFVDTAHRHGIAVILDVVYNHLGPDGNYLGQFAREYFTDKHKTDWGAAINFANPNVRHYFVSNAAYWVKEYHFDGLRLDATQNIYDDVPPAKHILTEIGNAVRAAANGRSTIVINENECQHSELCRTAEQGGYGLDALWNDDYHHTAMVALTGKSEAYYTDYAGSPQEFVSSAKYGYLYQGQWYRWQEQRRGRPGLDLPPRAFINFLENHDQVANSGHGKRAWQLTSPGRYRALHMLTLLMPATPMLFQGQEFQASSPFLYFADHNTELAPLVQKGRVEFLEQFPSLTDPLMKQHFAEPHGRDTFERCVLDFTERTSHAMAYQFTKDLLKQRRAMTYDRIDGAVLGTDAFCLRFFGSTDYLLVVNLGRHSDLAIVPEPLLAPPWDCTWELALSSDSPAYGGSGTVKPETDTGWILPGEAAVLLKGVRS